MLSALLFPGTSLVLPAAPAGADPAPAPVPGIVTRTTAGALASGTVPDGICSANVIATGGGGASSPTAGGITGGQGGAGATIAATFRVVPGQSYAGTVGAGAAQPTLGSSATAPGGSGDGSGGSGGTIVDNHRGGGGGGGSSVTFGGTKVLVAGGGGGGGAAHQNAAGAGGGAGFTGIAAGTVAVGSNGQVGVDTPGTANGGTGGQAGAGGAGGVQTNTAARNGSAGTGIGTGNGGNGGSDLNFDSGGGGGGGYTGGGGGASTIDQNQTGAGGGGGSSWVRATSVDGLATVPTSISGSAGAASPAVAGAGATGSLSIAWVPCNYNLALTKTVSPTSVNAGAAATWTVTVTNNGPQAMTRGDTLDLTDTLPAGPNGLPAPAYRVTAFTVTPGTNSGLAAGPLTCTGVAVNSALPTATNCSRAYSAPAAAGTPAGGTRGLDVGESISITYQQIVANTAPCATITNTATIRDRPAGAVVTDTVNTPLTINCYDLAVTKTASPAVNVSPQGTVTWTVTVTNIGPGDMEGPTATGANPLVVTDVFPTTGIGSPTLTGSTGPAGACTLAGSTTTCPAGLDAGQSQVLTYTQVVAPGTANGTTIPNTASVTDPRTGDTNDSATASTTVNAGALSLTKVASPNTGVVTGSLVTYTFVATNTGVVPVNGVNVTDPLPGLSAISCSPAAPLTLAPSASTTCTATRTVTQADVNAGSIPNTATANGTTAGGAPVSATASATVTPSQAASVSLTKSASPSSGVVAGDVVTYTFEGENTGTVTLTGVSVTDPLPGLSAITCLPVTLGVLDAGDTITCTATRTVTQADVDAGSIPNTATIAGLDPSSNPVSDTASATVTPSQAASISLTKSASPDTGVVAGDVVTYTFEGENTGSVTLTGVSVTDPLAGLSAVSCAPVAPATLAPNDTISCTATRTVTQADVNSGSIPNTATIAGLDPSSNPVSDTATATVTPSQVASVSLAKTASPNTGLVTGDVVTYTFEGENTGAVTLTGVGVSDPIAGLSAVSCLPAAPATLAPNDTISCTATRTVTQADVNSGSIPNTATIAGLDPSSNPVSDTATATVTPSQAASISLTKSASPSSGVVAGDVVTYTFEGENTGAVTLTGVSVTDPLPGLSAITCLPVTLGVLDAGDTITCTATRTVTQADVDAGSILNTATIAGLDPSDNPVSDSASATVTASQAASISLTKSASPDTGVVAGDVVTYTFEGENTGAVTLTGVSVTDPLAGLSAVSCTPAAPATLAPNDTISCTATRTVTQADVNSGSIPNTATISGLDPSDDPVSDTATATVTPSQAASISLTKTASPATGVVAGDVVTYTFEGENTGAVTLTGVNVTDPLPGLSAITCLPATLGVLDAGDTITCTATRTVTQADVNSGSIPNTATIAGLDPSSNPVSDTASATVTPSQAASISLTKTASPDTGVVTGDVVTYTFEGENTGAVTLTGVSVTDPLAGLSAVSCLPVAPATLAPNDTISCTATRTVTQADVNSGSIPNTATISGLDPASTPVSDTASATVTPSQAASVSLTKTASPNSGVVAGDVVTYTFEGENTGAVTLTGVSVTDSLPGLSAIACLPVTLGVLDAGDSITCTATRTVTQADVDAGSILNTATIAGLDPSSNSVSDTATATVTPSQAASVSLTKTASPNTGVVAGDVVTYTFEGENTGVVTLTDVGVSDPLAGLSAVSCTPLAPATLAPNDTISCTATRTVTQADVDGGSILNTATIAGLDPSDNPVSDTATATVTPSQAASVSLTKTASPNTGVVAGDVVTYTFEGENTGAVTLTDVGVSDPLTGLSAVSCVPAAPATLAPNDTISCTATRTVTQADVNSGSIPNTATIAGVDPADIPVSATASATVIPSQDASISLTKTASPDTGVVTGDVVTYTFEGENTGAVTLTGVSVTDPLAGLSAVSCVPAAPATLAPNDTISCTATRTVTQADVNSGSIPNTAMITGLDPSSTPVSDTATATVTPSQAASVSLTKTASPDTGVVAGDVVTYTFEGENTGAVTLTGVSLTDPLPGLSAITCLPVTLGVLDAGDTITCTATRTVTQADVDAGSIPNTATIAGLDPSDNPVSDSASATVTPSQAASISLTKSASPNTGVVTGDVVTYTFEGENTGAVTLTDVGVSDPLAGLSAVSCTPAAPATLAPNDTISCTATRTVTQADVNSGSIVNTATIAGVDPASNPVSDTSTATVTPSQAASISLTKAASPDTGVVAGDVVTYTFEGVNTGAVTLTGVSVTDPLPGLSAITCLPATLGVLDSGDSISCTATRTVTQADVNSGSIPNTATIAGLDPSSNPVSATASATVTPSQAASISLTKTASPDTGVVAGDVVTYTFEGVNTGAVTLTGVNVTDPLPGLSAITCLPATLGVLDSGDSISCTATRTVTQADVNAGSIPNTATISGVDPSSNPVSASASATVTPSQAAGLGLTKTASPDTGVVAGDVVTYSFDGVNTGAVTLTGVSVTDPLAGLSAVSCTPVAPATLAPNESISCTATRTVTQDDVNSGSIPNTASIVGLDPSNNQLTNTASATVTPSQAATVSLTKTASPSGGVVAGDVVTYSFEGANTGAVTLTGVSVSDPLAGLSAVSCTPVAPATLAPSDTISCTATRTVTQADVNAGSILNTATIVGRDPSNTEVTASASAEVFPDQTTELSLAKTASPAAGVAVGDQVTYTFAGQNTGAVTLHDVTLVDPLPGLSALTCAPTLPAVLDTGELIECTATYTVTQADVDAGSIVNVATITGLDPADQPLSSTATATVTPDQNSSLDFTKSVAPGSGVIAGDVLTYSFSGRNAGNTTLRDVTVVDPLVGLSAVTCVPSAPAVLAPNDPIDCSATYTVTQQDVNAGSIPNTATLAGVGPNDAPVSRTASAVVSADQSADISLTKSASPNSGLAFGDVITYTFSGQNTARTVLHDVTIVDPLPGLSALSCTPAVPAVLAAGESIQCSGSYTVTQLDIDNGGFTNTATITGLDPVDNPVTENASAVVEADQPASVTLTKVATPTSNLLVGDVVTYGFSATNSGGLTLHGVTITDPLPGLSALDCAPALPATLAPGGTLECTAEYTVSQADVDRGSIDNTATVDALDPNDNPLSAASSAVVTTDQKVSTTFTKSASPAVTVVGDIVTYVLTGTNTGTTTINSVQIVDPKPGLGPLDCTPALGSNLAPGGSITCTATYSVTEADAAAGKTDNTATLTGAGVKGPIEQSASATVNVLGTPGSTPPPTTGPGSPDPTTPSPTDPPATTPDPVVPPDDSGASPTSLVPSPTTPEEDQVSSLARTGQSLADLARLGVLALAGGWMVVIGQRRRRRG